MFLWIRTIYRQCSSDGVHTKHSISDLGQVIQDWYQARFWQLPTNEDSENKGADNLKTIDLYDQPMQAWTSKGDWIIYPIKVCSIWCIGSVELTRLEHIWLADMRLARPQTWATCESARNHSGRMCICITSGFGWILRPTLIPVTWKINNIHRSTVYSHPF